VTLTTCQRCGADLQDCTEYLRFNQGVFLCELCDYVVSWCEKPDWQPVSLDELIGLDDSQQTLDEVTE